MILLILSKNTHENQLSPLYLIIVACSIVVSAQEPQPAERKTNLMPVPASVKFLNERLAVDANFKVATRGHSDARLQAGVWRFIKPGRTHRLNARAYTAPDDQMTPLIVNCQGAGKNVPSVGEDEITASTSRGGRQS